MSIVKLIGSIDACVHYKASYIANILNNEQIKLGIGEDFIGRPDTRIYINQHDVVKIRAELDLIEEKAIYWTANILAKEIELKVHHPHKTWFIVADNNLKNVLVGSICPRLKPLNIEFKSPPQTPSDRSRYVNIMSSVFNQYFQLAKRSNAKLDEGLSNFAIDDKDIVYYLDDEYYSWDNFITFTVMLGVFLRSFSWLDTDFISELTQEMILLVDNIYQDPHCRIIISTQLQSLFMPSDEKQQLLSVMVTGLSKIPVSAVQDKEIKPKNKIKKSNERYIAVMADIHANEAALDSVLNFYKEKKINQGIVLGDIVGYGPDPKACIEKLQGSSFEIIKGNHDHAVAIANTDRGFSNNAKVVVNWSIEQLEETHLDWLKYLPPFLNQDGWYAVHGAPMDPAFFYGYVYLMTAEDNLDYMQKNKISLCFHGHSHMPGIYCRDKNGFDRHLTDEQIDLKKYEYILACPGSVGQSRNGTASAQCAVYDRENKILEFISLPYSVDLVVERMKKNDLPEALWQRLQVGT